MTTPDSFFNIKPDFKPGNVNRDDSRDSPVYDVKKPYEPPRTNKEFKEVLDDQEKKTGQPVAITKDSKVAPRLGVEKPAAPGEEPRAEPYIEQIPVKNIKIAPSIFDLSKNKADEKLHPELQNIVPAGIEEEVMPLTNKTVGQTIGMIDPLTGQLFTKKPLLKKEPVIQMDTPEVPEAFDTLPDQTQDALLAQNTVKEGVADQAMLTKIATYFEPLLGKLFGEKPKVRGNFGEKTTQPLAAHEESGQQQVNLLAQNVAPLSTSNQIDVEVQTASPKDIDEIVRQIVDTISTSTTSTQTDTTITLKYPPLLDGAVLTVTSFKTAPNEINVTFENLTQEGKNLLDNIGNRSALDSALDQKGFTMHMITTTTYVENLNFGDSSSLAREKREGRGGQAGYGGQGGQKGNQDQA